MATQLPLTERLEDFAGTVLESNEVPYIIPRFVIGAIILISSLGLMERASEESVPISEWGTLLLVGFVLIAWLIGYALDAISIAAINKISPLRGNQTMIYFKSLEGYRFLVMCSLFQAGLVLSLLHGFTSFVAPRVQQDYQIDFSFYLIFFVAVLVSLSGLAYAIIRRTEFDISIKSMMGEDEESLKNAKIISNLKDEAESLKSEISAIKDELKKQKASEREMGMQLKRFEKMEEGVRVAIREELQTGRTSWLGKS